MAPGAAARPAGNGPHSRPGPAVCPLTQRGQRGGGRVGARGGGAGGPRGAGAAVVQLVSPPGQRRGPGTHLPCLAVIYPMSAGGSHRCSRAARRRSPCWGAGPDPDGPGIPARRLPAPPCPPRPPRQPRGEVGGGSGPGRARWTGQPQRLVGQLWPRDGARVGAPSTFSL